MPIVVTIPDIFRLEKYESIMHYEIVLAYSIRCRVNPGYSLKARQNTTWAQALQPAYLDLVADGEPEVYQPLLLYTRWPAVRPPFLVRNKPRKLLIV